MRNAAVIAATVVVVVGAFVGVALVTGDDTSGEPRAAGSASRTSATPTSTPTPTPTPHSTTRTPTPTPTSTSAAGRYALASAGLRRVVAEHVPTTARPKVVLGSCPFAPGAPLAETALRAAHIPTGDAGAGRVDVADWHANGDRGVAVTCRFTGPRHFTIAAYTHVRKVAVAPIDGYDGPIPFNGGRLYRSGDVGSCAAYWAPPGSDYVLAVQFDAPQRAGAATCGVALRAIQPTVFAGLVRLQRTG